MSGLNIGIGVGMRYSYPTPTSGVIEILPPEEDITDGILSEESGIVLLTEDGKHFALEDNVTDTSVESISVKNKSYWNF